MEAGNLTWKEGLVLAGTGLGKGIMGNAYLLLSLSRSIKKLSQDYLEEGNDIESKRCNMSSCSWRNKAICFARAALDKNLISV
jgi:hypothetical protein